MSEQKPPEPLSYASPQDAAPQTPSSEEFAAAKWFSIGFLAITGVLMLTGIVIVVVLTFRFASELIR
jgi:hypothetical protein